MFADPLNVEPYSPVPSIEAEEGAFARARDLEIQGGNAQIDKEDEEILKRMREFDTGATRDSDTEKLDYEGFLSPAVIKAFAEYMHRHRIQADGSLRDSDNWQKGIPLDAYMKSLLRHVMEVWTMHRTGNYPDHMKIEALCAVLFNVQGYIYELEKRSEF